ncbi:MAG: prolipoprotein diacylglyceryl transferase [Oscillospiraceae bacterium]|nr:prolipoprotein diacylglyceryl transferase [Oscillospiraceae bacterium]MDD4412999.1 prolipoprotein diacylglyceryl transferase [Oscillospiraceae bacterium]
MKDFVEFPALNLKFGISDTIVQFRLFGMDIALRWYGLLIAIGFLLAVIYALRRAREFDIDPDRLIDVTLVSAIFAFIGARLYYVLFSGDTGAYFEEPLSILRVWEGGLAIYGGIIFAFITAIWMCRVRKVNTLAVFDIAALGFLIGQSIGRWGNFANQEAFGTNTDLPWGMTGSLIQQGLNSSVQFDPSKPVHPTFLYESLWCIIGFIILHFVSKKAYKFKGQIFSLYVIWYGFGRFLIEGLRTDSLMLGQTMRVSRVVAALSVFGGIALLLILRARYNSLPVDLFEELTADGAIPVTQEEIPDLGIEAEDDVVSDAEEESESDTSY